jgi:hypothetical protein
MIAFPPSSLFSVKSRLDLIRYLNTHLLTSRGAEIGVLFGEYSEYILRNWPGMMFLVDPWINQDPSEYLDGTNSVVMSSAYEKTKAAVAPFGDRAKLLRMYSLQAAQAIPDESLDFAFLDGNHAYKYIREDIDLWWPKVHHGGVLCGHDFYNRHDAYQECGVKTRVIEFARERRLHVVLTEDTSWFISKP